MNKTFSYRTLEDWYSEYGFDTSNVSKDILDDKVWQTEETMNSSWAVYAKLLSCKCYSSEYIELLYSSSSKHRGGIERLINSLGSLLELVEKQMIESVDCTGFIKLVHVPIHVNVANTITDLNTLLHSKNKKNDDGEYQLVATITEKLHSDMLSLAKMLAKRMGVFDLTELSLSKKTK